ncbi:MAG: hypothetical protein M3Q97_08600, partial [Bacteroidota bacterium]|nr:hypothetical protein [Bacteroidota bacterium]
PVLLASLFRKGTAFRDVLLLFIGLVTPYFFLFIGLHILDMLPDFQSTRTEVLRSRVHVPKVPWPYLIPAVYVLALSFFGYVKLRTEIVKRITDPQKMLRLFVLYSVLLVAGLGFVREGIWFYLQCFALPLAYFTARFFDPEYPRRYHTWLMLVLLLMLVFFQLVYFGNEKVLSFFTSLGMNL